MKKMNFFAVAALALVAVACGNNNQKAEAADDCENCADCKTANEKSVSGVVLDAAMNSVFIITPAGDTLSFGYPELNREKIASFELNDTITVNLAVVEIDGVQKDTVTSIVKGVSAASCCEDSSKCDGCKESSEAK